MLSHHLQLGAGPGPHTLHIGIPWTLTVVASNINRSFRGRLTLGDNLTVTGWTMFPGNAKVEKAPLLYSKSLSRMQYSVVLCDNISSMANQIREIASSQIPGAIIISSDHEILELGGVPCPRVLITCIGRAPICEN